MPSWNAPGGGRVGATVAPTKGSAVTAASPAPSAVPAASDGTRSDDTRKRAKDRPRPAARRFGYVVAAAVNIAFWVAIHVWPGWQEVPFLTSATTDVLPWVDAQIAVSVAANAIWLVVDPRWLRALGETVTAVVGLVATARILAVFPFSFDDDGVPWEQWVRVALVVAVVGCAIGVLANVVTFVRSLRSPDARQA